MKSIIAFLLSLVTAIATFFGNITPFIPEETTVPSEVQTSATELAYTPDKEDVLLFDAVNEVREASGKDPLILDYELCYLAHIRAEEQILEKGPCET